MTAGSILWPRDGGVGVGGPIERGKKKIELVSSSKNKMPFCRDVGVQPTAATM